MLSFSVPTKGKLTSLNVRSEEHGKTLVPAVDLRFAMDVPNSALAQYHPGLLDVLYEPGDQGQLDGIEHVAEVTELRFPHLKPPYVWDEVSHGHTLVIDYGIDGDNGISMPDCKLHKHTLTPKRGGTCTIEFTLSATHNLTRETLGTLGLRVRHDLWLTLAHTPHVEADAAS